MYLKKLTLNGFKSFAEPAELTFSKGVSAIVGPNGSGKSNITDAIRWVLGEQSTKSLRGKKMEDVIFSGTAQKKALGYAEVTLTLDNADGYIVDCPDEMIITRRLFRSGESEYKINQKSCRLKDILALFTDTGLGKNGYSVISQGGIEDITSANPMELRRIVEEAVGIVSYKVRKEEAERKLAHTQTNIERLSDILDEIEKQLKPLKQQSEKAKIYLELRETLKKVDLMMFLNNMQSTETELEAIRKQLKNLKFEIFDVEKKNNAVDFSFRQMKNKIRVLSEEMKHLGDEIEDLKEQIRTAERAELIATEKIEHEKENVHRFLRELEASQNERQRDVDEWKSLDVSDHEMTLRLREKELQYQKLQKEKESCLSEIDSEKAKQTDFFKKKASAEHERTVLNQEILALKERQLQWKAQNQFSEERIQYLIQEQVSGEKQLQETTEIFNQSKVERTQLIEAHNVVIQNRDAIREELKKLQEACRVVENNIQVCASKREYLKNIQKNYSDYFPAIRKLMNSKAHLGSLAEEVYGPVGELLTVPERYTMAVDVALGGKSQNIVVKNVHGASRCIEILKKERAGRAAFLPLDRVKVQRVDESDRILLKKQEGFVGIVSELVSFEPQFQPVMENLLGRILMVQDFKAGQQIQKLIKNRYTVVTLEGEIFYPGGAIVGGYHRKSQQSPLSKKAEIDKLDQEIQTQKSEKQALESGIKACLKKLESCEDAYQKNIQVLRTSEQESWSFQKKKEDAEQHLKRIQDELETLRKEYGEFSQKFEEIEAVILEKQKALEALEAFSQEEVQSDREYLEVLRTSAEHLSRKIAEAGIDLARDQENERSLKQQKSRVEDHLKQLDDRIQRLENELSDSRREQMLKDDARKQYRREIETWREAVQEKEALCISLGNQSEISKEKSEELEESIKGLNHDLILKNEAKSKAELAENRLTMQIEHWEEQIRETYDMNVLMVKDYCATIDPETVDIRPENQRRLKNQMTDLGVINVNAIEEYAALNERHSFMSDQYNDLIKGKQELETIIDSLYQSMEQQFQEKFSELQRKFSRVFSVLFEGGQAQISYTDPEHVLESGIELAAQPPGKNLRHISLLSGGEKSMIAIALLFSFIELNPAPFCVIDEIDAALDDHNIYRFTRYLEKIADENQFIIITHRKRTLEACDAIYGVSMAKNGISKLVSVRLSDYTEPAN